ncbi:MAG: TIGR04086 family membrane protein [Clostridia bacterium]|nr:TIGR04086 family membrane protein [Clostridia bacterium]
MSQKVKSSNVYSQVLRTGLTSLIVCTILVLMLALVVKIFGIPTSVLPVINQVIKVVSAILGSLFTVRGDRGLIKGILGAVLFLILSTVLFTLLGGILVWGQVGIDALLEIVAGALSGLIASSRTRSK